MPHYNPREIQPDTKIRWEIPGPRRFELARDQDGGLTIRELGTGARDIVNGLLDEDPTTAPAPTPPEGVDLIDYLWPTTFPFSTAWAYQVENGPWTLCSVYDLREVAFRRRRPFGGR